VTELPRGLQDDGHRCFPLILSEHRYLRSSSGSTRRCFFFGQFCVKLSISISPSLCPRLARIISRVLCMAAGAQAFTSNRALRSSVRKFRVRLITVVTGFMRDLADKSANKLAATRWGADSLTTFGIGILAASAQAEAVQKLTSQFVGDFSSTVQLLLQFFAMLWCVTVISSKTPNTGSSIIHVDFAPADQQSTYTYSQLLRSLAKLGLLALVIILPYKLTTVADDLLPLPRTIYGYLYKGADQPVDGARVRLVSRGGDDITSGTWFTDSHGFYIVKAVRRVRRSDVIKTIPGNCESELSLALTKSNEVPGGNTTLNPQLSRPADIFVHHINCAEK
jgi:hypothetical protein